MRPGLSLVIPTYNEAENLPVLLERLTRALVTCRGGYELIVVDDDSPDGTWRVAESLRARHPQLAIIRRTAGERGLAPAVVEGWRVARGERLGVMDADLQHPPELLVELLAAFEDPEVDVAIASRYTARGERLRWSPIRKWLSRGASNLAQAVLPPQAHSVTDPMSGYFLLRRRVLDGAVLRPRGYKILLEVLGAGRYRRVVDVPYQFGPRYRGASKLGSRVMLDYLEQLWRLAWAPSGLGRFVRYCLVGTSGVVVNLGVLWLLRATGLLGKLQAPAVAIECAILNNFLWNELWTFSDRSRVAPRLRDRVSRVIHFNLVCGAGAALHLALVWLLAIRWSWSYMATNVLAIGVVTLWNYGLNTSWTWTRLVQGAGGTRAVSQMMAT